MIYGLIRDGRDEYFFTLFTVDLMASPQIENGYIQIANELVDALCRTGLNGGESSVLWAVLRETYGWKTTERKLGIATIVERTGMTRSRVGDAVNSLLEKRILVELVPASYTTPRVLGLHKDYEAWTSIRDGNATGVRNLGQSENSDSPKNRSLENEPKTAKVGVSENSDSPKTRTGVSENSDTLYKENIKEISSSSYEEEDYSPEVASAVTEIPVVTIPLVGGKDEHPVYQSDIDGWAEAYPAIDIKATLLRIREWNKANPKNQKTKNGIRKHITGWLDREQNRARTRNAKNASRPGARAPIQRTDEERRGLIERGLSQAPRGAGGENAGEARSNQDRSGADKRGRDDRGLRSAQGRAPGGPNPLHGPTGG